MFTAADYLKHQRQSPHSLRAAPFLLPPALRIPFIIMLLVDVHALVRRSHRVADVHAIPRMTAAKGKADILLVCLEHLEPFQLFSQYFLGMPVMSTINSSPPAR